MRSQALTEARLLVRKSDSGVISTISHNLRGYPFGSVSPYISDSEGRLYFYISDIAQHSKNLALDSRMSMTIYNQADLGDQNEQGRVTIVGDAFPVEDELQQQELARYINRFPKAEAYAQAHGFKMWRLDIKRVRYIGGFGKIFWLEKDEWAKESSPWNFEEEQSMITNMNEDHQDAMRLILKQHHVKKDETPIMSGIVNDGFYITSKEKNYFVPFEAACIDKSDARKHLVSLTQAARAELS
ncbi:MAG: HugZ family protein [Parashewanella sp.]